MSGCSRSELRWWTPETSNLYCHPGKAGGSPADARTKREHFLDCLRGLPSRADIHDLELRLGERLDSLAARFDRTFDAHLS